MDIRKLLEAVQKQRKHIERLECDQQADEIKIKTIKHQLDESMQESDRLKELVKKLN